MGIGYDIKSRKIWGLYEQQTASAAATDQPDASSSSSSSSSSSIIECPAAPSWLVEGELHLPSVSFPDVDWILGCAPFRLRHHPSLQSLYLTPPFQSTTVTKLLPTSLKLRSAAGQGAAATALLKIYLTRPLTAGAVTLSCRAASGTSKASSRATTRGSASTRCCSRTAAADVANRPRLAPSERRLRLT